MIPIRAGDLWRGTAVPMIVRAPFIKPADPKPAMARAIMSIMEELATPHSKEPNSNTKKKLKKVHFRFFSLA